MRPLVFVFGLVLPGLTIAAVPTRYRFDSVTITDLGTLGGGGSYAYDINEGGDIVGQSSDALGKQHAVAWFDGTIYDLHSGTPAWETATAYSINDNREVVGHYRQTGTGGRWRAFKYYPGTWLTPLAGHNPAPALPFVWNTYAYAINNSGRIAGEAIRIPDSSFPPPPDTGTVLCYENLAVQWASASASPVRLFCPADVNGDNDYNPDGSEGTWPKAYDVNDSGNFVGNDGATSTWSMFLFKDGVRLAVPPPAGAPDMTLDGEAKGINNKNWVVGTFGWPDGGEYFRAFVWDGVSANSVNLGMLPGGMYSYAEEINEQNMVTGMSERYYGPWPMARQAAYLWHKDFGMKQLPGLTGVFGFTGGQFVWMYDHCWAYSLNDRKAATGLVQVVGRCRTASGSFHAVRWDITVSVVPYTPIGPTP